nr:NnrS family protein [Alkalilimnicola ehrlichii]
MSTPPRLLAYGFRSFFLLAAGYGAVAGLYWAGALSGIMPLPDRAIDWHAFEMVFGFAGAGLAGFLLTAAPDFTGTRPVTGKALLILIVLWLAGRLALWASGWLGLLTAAVTNLTFLGLLIAYVGPPSGRMRAAATAYSCICCWRCGGPSYWYSCPGPAGSNWRRCAP